MPPLFDIALIDTIRPSVEQTLPRSLVHKRSHENVLLTEMRAAGDDRFLCTGRIPTAHTFFNEAGRLPQQDILFYTELGRQASLAISHAFLNVDSADVFIFEGSEAAVTGAALNDSSLWGSDAVAIEVRLRETARRRNNAISRVVADHLMFVAGRPVFHGTGAWTVQPAALFQRLRRTSAAKSATVPPGSAAPPAGVTRHPRQPVVNTVISPVLRADEPDAFVASLVVDERHPYFFDHPCDHVPGMLLLEACAQVAVAAFAEATAAPARAISIASYDVTFDQFVECGIPAVLTAHLDPAAPAHTPEQTVRVAIAQAGAMAGTTTIRLTSAI